jgi:formate transporter
MKYTETLYRFNLGFAAHKKEFNIVQLILLSFLAGCYLGFGVTFSIKVGGELGTIITNYPGIYHIVLGTFGLPFSLLLIVVCGAELFTSDCSYMMSGMLEHKLGFIVILRTLLLSYFGNLSGCLFIIQLLVAANTYNEDNTIFAISYAEHKVSNTFLVTMLKGIVANWLVNLAVLMANGADDLISKFVGIWLPIAAFVSMGFEHCIANMFIVPLGITLGADITVNEFIVNNLIPATLGNMIGGMGFVSGVYYLCFGDINQKIDRGLERLRFLKFFESQKSIETGPVSAVDHT